MRIIGITGGVGSGKSRVLSYMNERFRAVICQADHIAWELQKPGGICYTKIVEHFGENVLKEDGTINRAELGKIVFADADELRVLNQIMHPEVKNAISQIMISERDKGTDLVVLEAALLLEEHYDEICDEVWYIYANDETRRNRLKDNRQYSDEKIDSIMKSQLPESVFRDKCQVIIDNSGDFRDTCCQIENVMIK